MFKFLGNIVTVGVMLVVAWIVGHIYGEYRIAQARHCVERQSEQKCVEELDWSGRIIREKKDDKYLPKEVIYGR